MSGKIHVFLVFVFGAGGIETAKYVWLEWVGRLTTLLRYGYTLRICTMQCTNNNGRSFHTFPFAPLFHSKRKLSIHLNEMTTERKYIQVDQITITN